MALLAKAFYDFGADKSSAADDDDFHFVSPNSLVALVNCAGILVTRMATLNEECSRSGPTTTKKQASGIPQSAATIR
jgi:hypothetical protein